MPRIIEYKTLYVKTEKIDYLVNEAINEGWQPYGTPYELDSDNYDHVRQVVVKYETTEY